MENANFHRTSLPIGATDTIVVQSNSDVDSISIIREFTCTKEHSVHVSFNLSSSTQSTDLEYEYRLSKETENYWISDKPSLSSSDTIVFSELRMRLFVENDFICTDTSSEHLFQLGDSIPLGVVMHKTSGTDTVWCLGTVGHVTGSACRKVQSSGLGQSGSQIDLDIFYDPRGRLVSSLNALWKHKTEAMSICVKNDQKFLFLGATRYISIAK